jgi:hypothetical protein
MVNQYELDAWVVGLPDMIKNPQPSQFDNLVNQMKQSGEAGNTAYVNTKRNWFTDGIDAVKRWATQPTPTIEEVGIVGGNPLDIAMGKNKNFQLSENADKQIVDNAVQKAWEIGRSAKKAVIDWTSPHPGLGAEQKSIPLDQGTETVRSINNPSQGSPDPQARQVDSEGDPELRGLSDNQLEDLVKSLVAGTGQAQSGGIFDRIIKEKSRRAARAGRQPYESYRGLDRLQSLGNYDLRAQQEGVKRMRDAIDSSWAENDRLNGEGATLQMMGNTVRR